MKLATLALSLSSAAIGSAITIGDNVTMAVPAGQHYGPDGIQANANAAATEVAAPAPAPAPAKDEKDEKAGIVIGDNNTFSGTITAPYPTAVQNATQVDDKIDATKPQEVALVAKAASGTEAKIDGSLGIKTAADGSADVYIKDKAAGDAQTFSLKDGVASGANGISLYAAGKAEASISGSMSGSVHAQAQASAEHKLEFDAAGKITNVHFYASADMKVGISIDGQLPSGAQPIEVYKAAASAEIHATNGAQIKTDYVTYCPSATTLTVTTCVSEVCAATEIAVTTATTITVRGGGVVAASAHASAGVSVAKPAISAPSSSVRGGASTMASAPKSSAVATASVSSYVGGAARNIAGVAGLAGMAVLLM